MQAFERARWRDTLAMSRPVFDEIAEVLDRPRLTRFIRPDLRARLLALLSSGARWFDPAIKVADCRDPADDKYLELALEAGASTVVSSDRDLLVLHPWRGVHILRPAEYLAI